MIWKLRENCKDVDRPSPETREQREMVVGGGRTLNPVWGVNTISDGFNSHVLTKFLYFFQYVIFKYAASKLRQTSQ
jgi:hypothetical protein